MNRHNNLQRLETEDFDLLIIGAGASGTGCALDAALRGLRVALIEKEDFAAGTSSKSTKLIHGGVRYLEQAFKNFDFAQLKQVKHGLEERHTVLCNAPHLAQPLGLITPVNSWIEGLYFSIGLKIYGWFAAGQDNLPKSQWLSKKQALQRMPGLSPHIHSAIMYYDGQLDDARYCVAMAQSAEAAGAAITNHTELTGFEHNDSGQLTVAWVRDNLTGHQIKVRAKHFLNCAGPYADPIRKMANAALTPRIRPSKGVHAILPYTVLNSKDAMLIPKTKDGRVVFAIPFGQHVMLGTTDTDYQQTDQEPVLEAAEIAFLLETLAPFVSKPPDAAQVSAGFGGLRPLIAADPSKGTKNLVRDHEVEHDPKSGLLSLLGGKWTTYRLMAADAIDAACSLLKNTHPCITDKHLLWGSKDYRFEIWQNLRSETGLEADICQHLLQKYGTYAREVAALAQKNANLRPRIVPGYPFILAEVVYAAKEEMACTVRDFLARRLRLEIEDWQAAISATPAVAKVMGTALGWSAAEETRQAAEYIELVETWKLCLETRK